MIPEFFISSGTVAHIFGPRNATVSVPLKTVLTLVEFKEFKFRRLYGISLSGKTCFINVGERFFTLYISVAVVHIGFISPMCFDLEMK